MIEDFETFKKRISTLKAKVDACELGTQDLSQFSFEQLSDEFELIKHSLEHLLDQPSASTIDYRLQLQQYKGSIKHLDQTLKNLKPKMGPTLNTALPTDDLFDAYHQAIKEHTRNPKFKLSKDEFIASVKSARKNARKYYDGAKTEASLGKDAQGPFISIKRKK